MTIPSRDDWSQENLDRLNISPEVAWYLDDRGFGLPAHPPLFKTPEGGSLEGSVFDPEAVDKVIKTFRSLRHTQGQWAGQPLEPDPWQVAYILAPVFGWLRINDAGKYVRIVSELYVEVPRKNGKSTICGGLGLHLTCCDGEAGAQVYAAATTERQAGFVFSPVKTLAANSPHLKPYVKAYKKKILHPKTGSYFEVIASAADAHHGANIHGAVVDELHVHESPDLVEVLETGTGSREQPLMVFITTADSGKPATIYERKRLLIEQLARGALVNPTKYGVIFAVPRDANPFSELTHAMANPGYGISPTRDYLTRMAEAAKQSPGELASFQRLHLGIRTKQTTPFVKLEDWDTAAGLLSPQELGVALEGKSCHGGLDMASTQDLTALCLLFPADDRESYRALWRFWVPEDRMPDLNKRTAGQADWWVRDGYLTTTPGNVFDTTAVNVQLDKDAQRYDILTCGFDSWGSNDVTRKAIEAGMEMTKVGQGYASLTAPMKQIQRLVMSKKLDHGGNPVMRWMTDNLSVATDPSGNVKPDKSKAADKIDGWSALATAMKEAIDTEDEGNPADSVW